MSRVSRSSATTNEDMLQSGMEWDETPHHGLCAPVRYNVLDDMTPLREID
ncbi:unnamed protein product [Rhodiola kirilowii]